KSSSTANTISFAGAVETYFESGFEIAGMGWDLNVGRTVSYSNEQTWTDDESKSRTIGFVLDDDDPGDGFAFSVKSDPYWGMPVFELIGGQSSCPYEAGTFRRNFANIGISKNLLVDIPPDEPAVFTLSLGNRSDTDEAGSYVLSLLNESNPYSARLLTGENLANGVPYDLEAGENLEVTLQVFRGPVEYEYDNLVLDLSPACGGADSTSDQVSFSAHFIEPCSRSNISNLENGWLIDSSHGSDTLWVTVNGYNWYPDEEMHIDSFMTSIDLQYRSGLGDWFTAYSIPADSLEDSYVLLPFNISDNIIIDGAYELRSQAQCSAGKYPGTSQIISGLIDRSAPEVLGLPEPVDGILGPDDLIRVTFNENVACGEISPGAGDILLYNTVTGNQMDYEYTCGGNVITFEPNVQNMFIENQIFRGEIHNLEDVFGNKRGEPVVWEFYINRNPIEWNGTGIENVVMYVDEEYSTTRTLMNNGGSNRSWSLIGGREGAIASGDPLNIPHWLNISPNSGTLTPGASQNITISLVEGLNFGSYSTTLYAAGTMGDEPLIIDLRKLGYEPIWTVNPSNYSYSMTVTALLSTEDGLSDDIYDMVGVFFGNECRGVANITYVQELNNLANTHAYEVFLTVYSNESQGEKLSLRMWDASECQELGWIELAWADDGTEFEFKSNEVLGTPTLPTSINATDQIISSMGFPKGWSWLSLNLENPDMSLNNLLTNMSPSDGDIIRDQLNFSQFVSEYNNAPVNQWIGRLDALDNHSMVMIKMAQADTLEMVGYAVDVELDTLEIASGWNWISYQPQV
ncbi:MAG: hypothetical protein KAI81_07005, partial [Candidatus Marinimicrobia bacterium]|nr:hypothetical protein [Candidatus Neomarinimicrobiota bacterium]